MNLQLALSQITHPLAMKQFTIAVLFFVSLVAQTRAKVFCGGFPTAGQSDCGTLIDNGLGEGAEVPVVNGKATIFFGTCALVTQASAGGRVTKGQLAEQGKLIYFGCNTPLISGYATDNILKKTCMMNKNAYVMVFISLY